LRIVIIKLTKLYQILRKHYGHRGWWPGAEKYSGGSQLEVIIGAILTQNTAWKNVEKALQNLKDYRVLNFKALVELPQEDLAHLIRPSGYFNQKALKIKAFLRFVQDEYRGNIKKMFATPTVELRKQLLSIKGIGPETADCILLYAGEHLSFVIDLYTYRIMTRHGWAEEEIDYHGLQELFASNIPDELDLYQDFHAQLVAVGNQHCRKTPKCAGCPLEAYLNG
jgi:endonuclease-3 related protein